MCKTVEDAAMILSAIAGYDALDSSTVDVPVVDYVRAVRTSTSKLRLGSPKIGFYENLHPEVATALDVARGVLGKLTAGVREVQVPEAGSVTDIWNPEIYAYHTPWITKSPELYQDANARTDPAGCGHEARGVCAGASPPGWLSAETSRKYLQRWIY
jgi:aspartyl-tRNA(Asn)/glutamyl-tRNA(Gln) amidotransferase subunit A